MRRRIESKLPHRLGEPLGFQPFRISHEHLKLTICFTIIVVPKLSNTYDSLSLFSFQPSPNGRYIHLTRFTRFSNVQKYIFITNVIPKAEFPLVIKPAGGPCLGCRDSPGETHSLGEIDLWM